MQVPTRKKETYRAPKADPHMTADKFTELSAKLKKMKIAHPLLSLEVQRLAAMGDFSENAGYQLAKSRLRGLNQRISDLESLLKQVEIIESDSDTETIKLGHYVTLKSGDQIRKYQILGSSESDPQTGIISHSSPLGAALLNRRFGETVQIKINDKIKEYYIIKIEY